MNWDTRWALPIARTIAAPRPRPTRWSGSTSKTAASAKIVFRGHWKRYSAPHTVAPDRGPRELSLGGSWLVTPLPAEQLAAMLGHHRGKAHHPHHQEHQIGKA